MSRETQSMQRDDTRQSGHAVGARRRGAVEQEGRPGRARLRRLPWRRQDNHARGRCPLPGLQRGGRAPDRSRAAHQRMPLGAPGRARSLPHESQEMLGALGLCRAPVARAADRAAARTSGWRPSASKGRASTRRARGSSTSPARSATTTMPAGGSPARQSRKAIRPATRSTGSSGRASARCSGACATASSGMRAEAFPYGAPEYVDLELYLATRAAGMTVETPAVRP